MTAATITEEEYNADDAAEVVVMLYNLDGTPGHISICDEVDGEPRHEIDRNRAIAIAERLLHLAQSLPNPPQILPRRRVEPFRRVRRRVGVDDQLRKVDGL